MRTRIFGRLFAAVACMQAMLSFAQDAPRPEGPVVLTITGEVGRSNRGPLDPFLDKMMAFQGTTFRNAMEFDYAALAALGMQKVKVQGPGWSAPQEFEGPLLKDVLAAASVSGGKLQPVGLDGYAAEILYADLEKWPVILALKMNGRWLSLGGAGPAWIIYPRDRFAELANDDGSKWVWGISHVRVIK